MTIESYMRTAIANLNNKKLLSDLMYCESDKDCGYRSGLRYLKLKQTTETDDIASVVIYGNCLKNKVLAQHSGQMEMFS